VAAACANRQSESANAAASRHENSAALARAGEKPYAARPAGAAFAGHATLVRLFAASRSFAARRPTRHCRRTLPANIALGARTGGDH
jgi:hypothetical protein